MDVRGRRDRENRPTLGKPVVSVRVGRAGTWRRSATWSNVYRRLTTGCHVWPGANPFNVWNMSLDVWLLFAAAADQWNEQQKAKSWLKSTSMTFKLFGHDVSASKTFKNVGQTAAGVATGMGAAFAASKLKDWAKDSHAFDNVGKESLKPSVHGLAASRTPRDWGTRSA